MREIFGLKGQQETGVWIKFIMRNFIVLLFSDNIMVVSSRRLRWEWHVACT
jgi:hypothetical protein